MMEQAQAGSYSTWNVGDNVAVEEGAKNDALFFGIPVKLATH